MGTQIKRSRPYPTEVVGKPPYGNSSEAGSLHSNYIPEKTLWSTKL